MRTAIRVVALVMFAGMLGLATLALYHCLPHLKEVTCGCVE